MLKESGCLVLAVAIFFISCNKEEVPSVNILDGDCQLSSYMIDISGFNSKMEINYLNGGITEIRQSYYSGSFLDSVKTITNVSYNSNNKPERVSSSTSDGSIEFFYDKNNYATTRMRYIRGVLPSNKTTFEWTNGNISKISNSNYEVIGHHNDVKSYIERENEYLILKFDSFGNLVNTKRYENNGKLLIEVNYEYDSMPNPFKNLFFLIGGFSFDSVHFLSNNNPTKVRYSFVNNPSEQVVNYSYSYNLRDYPVVSPGYSKASDIKYICN